MKSIVCDTGPILHLKEANLLELLRPAGHIHIPLTVEREIKRIYPGLGKSWPEWISVEPLQSDEITESESLFNSGLLHLGEAEAIMLAKRLHSEWFLTDDTAARLIARSMNIEVHGSLGVVLWSAAVGHLNRVESNEALEKLSRTSLWISKEVLSKADQAIMKIFEK